MRTDVAVTHLMPTTVQAGGFRARKSGIASASAQTRRCRRVKRRYERMLMYRARARGDAARSDEALRRTRQHGLPREPARQVARRYARLRIFRAFVLFRWRVMSLRKHRVIRSIFHADIDISCSTP